MTESPRLFPDEPTAFANPTGRSGAKAWSPKAAMRVLTPAEIRSNGEPSNLESLLPLGHRARIVRRYFERQNLEGVYAPESGGWRAAQGTQLLPRRFGTLCGFTLPWNASAVRVRWPA